MVTLAEMQRQVAVRTTELAGPAPSDSELENAGVMAFVDILIRVLEEMPDEERVMTLKQLASIRRRFLGRIVYLAEGADDVTRRVPWLPHLASAIESVATARPQRGAPASRYRECPL